MSVLIRCKLKLVARWNVSRTNDLSEHLMTGEALLALTCVTAGALGAGLRPLVGARRGLERPAQVIEVPTHGAATPAVARAGKLSLRLVNQGAHSERLELVQLDQWRLLGDPFGLGPGAVRTLEVDLKPGEYALLRLDGAPSEPGLVWRVMVR